jgi:hypothetical protein
LPAYVASALFLGFGWWAAYRLVRFIFWDPWDRRARTAILHAAALAARERAHDSP